MYALFSKLEFKSAITSSIPMLCGGFTEFSDCTGNELALKICDEVKATFNAHPPSEEMKLVSVTPLKWKSQVVRGIKYVLDCNVEHTNGIKARVQYTVWCDIDKSIKLQMIDGQAFP
ncbi:hypothetical protein ADUPG1_003929 [Aduncisulcus paluster]|uniref:Cystatin domain-containing protein n=1 Tax=Aduncisulcus paluster TaxID=2918883 RepID=A0ABQ5JTE6_9EUKA|nr:hypothetical protein ADUPG1_003929 [Aduncisulcus paluster]